MRPAHRLSAGNVPQPACWLLVEWPVDADAPTRYFLSNLPPNTSLKRLVHTAKDRWWIEHSYRQMKGELGSDHFVTRSPCAAQEGWTWIGWHHDVTLVMLADLFLVMRPQKKSRLFKGNEHNRGLGLDDSPSPPRTPATAALLVGMLPHLRTLTDHSLPEIRAS
ncbi:MAG: hypothetical protein KDA52_02405 [Planctomycetaceae bacterium]|nr:hypothetical protein [Planctomycetaceae bacterium]